MNRLDAIPRTLRWALFLPVGIIAVLIVDSVLNSIFDAARVPGSPTSVAGLSRVGWLALAWGVTLTVIPAVLSPRPWAVGLVMLAGGLLVRIAPVISAMTVPYQRVRLQSQAVALSISIGAHLLGGVAGLYLIRALTARRTND